MTVIASHNGPVLMNCGEEFLPTWVNIHGDRSMGMGL